MNFVNSQSANHFNDVIDWFIWRLFTQADFLRRHIKIIDECYKDFKYDSCVKLFTHVGNVRRHIKTVHEGHKDSKCDSYGKSFSLLPNSVLLLGRHFYSRQI